MRPSRLADFLLRRECLFLAGAVLLAAIAAGIVWFTRPSVLTVAVGPRYGSEARLIEAYAAALERAHEDVRLKVALFDDVRDSAAALQANRADLAVVRPDAALAENGLTLAVLHEAAVILAAPASGGIAALADLSEHRLGIVAQHDADVPLLRRLLEFYSLAPRTAQAGDAPPEPGAVVPGVTLVPVAASDVADAFASGRIDAVAVVATPASAMAAGIVHAVAGADKAGKVAFLAIPDAAAITQRFPDLDPVSIPSGTFGGRPKWPEEEVATIGISYRLMAREGLSRDLASSVTQHLFELRSRLARAVRSANLMKAPDFEDAVGATSARLPNHPGAVDYFQREQQTFFQRYEDLIYLVAFCGGGVGSAFAWVGQRLARKRREAVDVALDRLVGILADVREAHSADRLDDLAAEVDALVTAVIAYARSRTIDTRTMGALALALDAARSAVADRRVALSGSVGTPPGRRASVRAAE